MTKKTKYLIICIPEGRNYAYTSNYERHICCEKLSSALHKARRVNDFLSVDIPYKPIAILKVQDVYVRYWRNRKEIKALEALLEGGRPELIESKAR